MPEYTGPSVSWPERPHTSLRDLLADAATIELIERHPPAFRRAYQAERLTALVHYVRGAYPFWRDRLSKTAGKARLSDLPILSRFEFRAFNDTLPVTLSLPAEHGKVVPNATSGSTGVPSKFFSSDLHQRIIQAQGLNDHRRHGRDLSWSTISIVPRAPQHDGAFADQRTPTLLGGGRRMVRSRPRFTIEEHARFLHDQQAYYLATTPSALDGILSCFEADDTLTASFSQVLTYGETVTPELRQRTRAVFGGPIRDVYSCEEIGPIAHECPKTPGFYHTAGSHVFVEVLNADGSVAGAGVQGRIVVTGFFNFASPTIRFDIGDVGTMYPRCPCGDPHPALTGLLGRVGFLVRLPSGQRAVAASNAKEWLAIAPVTETRIVQTEPGKIVAEYVLDRDMTADEEAAVIRMMANRISAELRYAVKRVDSIPKNPGGKSQAVVSLV